MTWQATTIPALLMLVSASAAAGVTIVTSRHQASSQAIGIARKRHREAHMLLEEPTTPSTSAIRSKARPS